VRARTAGKPRLLAAVIVLMALVLAGSVGAAAWFVHDLTAGLPGEKEIHGLGDMAQATTILDVRDTPVFTIFKEQRLEVPIEKVSPELIKAVISIEDQRFYDHSGVDVIRIAAAALRNFRAGRRAEGGSTITQQLARQSFLTRDKTYRRKLKEAVLAARIEREFSKPQILEMYLNKVYFGDGFYGVEAAARGYFGKHASEVTTAEAALLAGLIQSPSSYAPTANLDRAVGRRNVVLGAMLSNDAITRPQYEQARGAAVHLTNGLEMKESFGLYYKEQVRRELVERFGATRIAEGGLKVYTTIDPRLQKAAEKSIRDTLNEHNDPAAAIVAIEPGTGAIRAMASVIPGNKTNQFNLAAQSARQAGSTFKSFVLAAAIEKGIDPDSTYYTSAPFTCTQSVWCEDDYKAGKPWQVSTYDHTYVGSTSITRATLRSDNTVYAQLTLDVGPDYVWRMAKRLGVHLTQKPVASIGLGSLSVSPLDMATAYATFAAGGIYAAPMAITKVVLPSGQVDEDSSWGHPDTKRALSPGVAWKVNDVLKQNALYGTGYGSNDGIHPNAGKTGTTEDHADAWFVGYTRDLSTAVWMGYPRGEIPMLDVHGVSVAGATFAVPIWHQFMAAAERHRRARDFIVPKNPPVYRPFTKQYFGYVYVPPPPPAAVPPPPTPAPKYHVTHSAPTEPKAGTPVAPPVVHHAAPPATGPPPSRQP
jgi:penicillin-binding protein 1A